MLFRKNLNYSMNKAVFTFVIYMIHELADSWKMLPSRVFHIYDQTAFISQKALDALLTFQSSYEVK